jgi:hypothetical protein
MKKIKTTAVILTLCIVTGCASKIEETPKEPVTEVISTEQETEEITEEVTEEIIASGSGNGTETTEAVEEPPADTDDILYPLNDGGSPDPKITGVSFFADEDLAFDRFKFLSQVSQLMTKLGIADKSECYEVNITGIAPDNSVRTYFCVAKFHNYDDVEFALLSYNFSYKFKYFTEDEGADTPTD